jgi:hypothetical protein
MSSEIYCDLLLLADHGLIAGGSTVMATLEALGARDAAAALARSKGAAATRRSMNATGSA